MEKKPRLNKSLGEAKPDVIISHSIAIAKYSNDMYAMRIFMWMMKTLTPEVNEELDKHLMGEPVSKDLFHEVVFSLNYNEIITEGESHHTRVKAALNKLMENVISFKDGDSEILTHIVQSARLDKKRGMAEFSISESMKQFMVQFAHGFHKFNYEIAFNLAPYSAAAKLYMLLSGMDKPSYELDLATLKKMLNIEKKYSEIKALENKVLLPSFDRINEATGNEISYSYELIKEKNEKTGYKSYNRIKFIRKFKKSASDATLDEILNAKYDITKDAYWFQIEERLMKGKPFFFTENDMKSLIPTIEEAALTFGGVSKVAGNVISECYNRILPYQDMIANLPGYFNQVLKGFTEEFKKLSQPMDNQK